ncbi:cupin domain-containing protein [Lawsonella clevelandensis]|nr:cupin domain-containing protein [Lawsonella clevelandensis]
MTTPHLTPANLTPANLAPADDTPGTAASSSNAAVNSAAGNAPQKFPEGVTPLDADHPDAGSDNGTYTLGEQFQPDVQPFPTRPRTFKVLNTSSGKVVGFAFAAGQTLQEHAARHPVLIQVLKGRVTFHVKGEDVELVPGRIIHLTPMLRHSVEAHEDSILTVTMLLPHNES